MIAYFSSGEDMTKDRLTGKRILAVDDEPDVLESLEEILSMCEIVKASRFEEAERLVQEQSFDIAILDIMGVEGYRLLDMLRETDTITVMLTAHAFSPKETVKSFKKGAASYIPKEEMGNIALYLNDVLEAKEHGKHFWSRWLDRFASYYDEKFGPGWQDEDKEFWEKFKVWY